MAEKQETKSPNWAMSPRRIVKLFYENITVEPMLALYMIGSIISNLATQNLSLEKACRVNFGYREEVCRALEKRQTANYTREEEAVQKLVASMAVWKTLIQSSIPAVLILFFGGWSDRHSTRKPFLLLPIVGEFLTSIGMIFNTYFFYELPMEVVGITEGFFPAMTGGWMTMFMAVFSYIADVTSVESRTLRVGIVNVCISVSFPLGTAVSGVLYRIIGFYGVYSLSASIYILAFACGYYGVNENNKIQIETKEKQEKQEPVSCCDSFRDFFDLKHIKETISVTFKHGANNRMKRVICLMIAIMVIIGPLHGEMTVMYLFTRFRFNWDEVSFSIFSTYSMITNLVGTLLSVVVFSHILKVDDAVIGMMSCMSKILASFVYAFATTTWMIYLAPLAEIMNGTSFIAMRSIVSKLVPTDELGKINSMIGLAESVVPVIYGPMYSAVYASTMDTMPGTFFLLGGGLTFPAVLIFLWMYGQHRGDRQRLKLAEEAEKNKTENRSSKLTGIDNAAFVSV